jgi:hypothetical protein
MKNKKMLVLWLIITVIVTGCYEVVSVEYLDAHFVAEATVTRYRSQRIGERMITIPYTVRKPAHYEALARRTCRWKIGDRETFVYDKWEDVSYDIYERVVKRREEGIER